MKDEALRCVLNRLEVPLPDDGTQEKTWHRARTAFVNRPPDTGGATISLRERLLSRFALGVAVVLAVLVAAFLWPRTAAHLPDRSLLGEIETLFPGELTAVVTRGDDIKVEVSDHDGGSRSQPLFVTLRRGRETIEVLTYSGSRVCLTLQGRTVCFEPLATVDGRMILAGENFVWRTDDRQLIAGYEVQAGPASAL